MNDERLRTHATGSIGAVLMAVLGGTAKYGDDVMRAAPHLTRPAASIARPAEHVALRSVASDQVRAQCASGSFHRISHLSRLQWKPAYRPQHLHVQLEPTQTLGYVVTESARLVGRLLQRDD